VNPFSFLSYDDYLCVLNFLNPRDLATVAKVSRDLNEVALHRTLWAHCKFDEETTGRLLNMYTRAAQMGNPQAQFKLGVLYHFGEDIPEDFQMALMWYVKAAAQGDKKAQYNIGCMYDKGQGVEHSFEEANKWFLKAAEGGNPHAQNALGINFEKGDGCPVDLKQALDWYYKAALQGLCDAQFNLGVFYSRHDEGIRDIVRAHAWYSVAADNNDADAAEHKDKLVTIMSPEQIAQSHKLYQEILLQIKQRVAASAPSS